MYKIPANVRGQSLILEDVVQSWKAFWRKVVFDDCKVSEVVRFGRQSLYQGRFLVRHVEFSRMMVRYAVRTR